MQKDLKRVTSKPIQEMINSDRLYSEIKKKGSFLCVGLDSDIKKIPAFLHDYDDPVFEFNRRIIDATAPYTVAYKPNVAFYESNGAEGWNTLVKTAGYIRENHPGVFIIADAKRGDIGNTSGMYARAFFGQGLFDAVTVAPYMGRDSVSPFLEYAGHWVILLALTSNPGADDFQYHGGDGDRLYEKVLSVSQSWGTTDNMMFVVGATRAEMLSGIRTIVPDHFLLVPGVGAQGGSLEEVARYGMNSRCGLLVNSSRGIIFADSSESFDQAAAMEASKIAGEMRTYLKAASLI